MRSHGLRGDVVVDLVTDRVERVAAGSVLDSDRGPLTVETSRPHQGRWIVAFAGVSSRDAADDLRGVVLRAEPLEGEDDALWVHELIGSTVVDVDGVERGVVESVQSNPASDLLVLDTGALVPLTFVTGHGDRRVTIDPPPGLFDL